MQVRVLVRCASNDGKREVELQAGRVYDLPSQVAQHLIELGMATEVKIPQQKKVVTPQIKTTKRPVRKSGTKTNNG